MSLSKIRIGIYGASGSGKTSFLRQLVRENSGSVTPNSKFAQWLAATIGPDNRVLPTLTSTENLELKIGRTTFQFSDEKGELLSAAMDQLDLEHRRRRSRNLLTRQIARSDALLFFFDPTAQNSPEQVQKHHREELLRAKQLIDFVLESRQNRLLPILFVLTHQDRIVQNPETVRLTEKWIDEVENHLEESYSQLLMGYFPRPLVREENLFHRLSLSTGTSVESNSAKTVDDTMDVIEKTRSLVQLVEQFRRRDRQRSRLLVVLFVLCTFLLLFVPILCLTSSMARNFLLRIGNQAAPVWERLPSLSGDSSELSESAIDLTPLFEEKRPLGEQTVASLNRSLFVLMTRLNQFEDAGQTETEEYAERLALWKKSFAAISKKFDEETARTPREKLGLFSQLLAELTDNPKRQTPALTETFQKFWSLYRRTLLDELRTELSIHRGANAPSKQILDVLCQRLERAFREVSESRVRGNFVFKDSDAVNWKESLRQDIRKAFIACRNYSDRYPVEVKIQSAKYASTEAIDRNYDRRLLFYGGKEKGEIYVDLTIASGFGDDKNCTFLPSRKDITVSFALDHPLRVALQQKPKGSGGEWERVSAWEISSEAWNVPSLESLGVLFYLRFENDENTLYVPEYEGFAFEFIIRRPRSVPEFLWELADPDISPAF